MKSLYLTNLNNNERTCEEFFNSLLENQTLPITFYLSIEDGPYPWRAMNDFIDEFKELGFNTSWINKPDRLHGEFTIL